MAKIAVYAICKNEARHAARFMASMSSADGVFILDTGSTDGSPQILRDLGAVVQKQTITPWRFDTARNLALAMVPPGYDICVSCDLDEVFSTGWRQALEETWQPDTTRMSYPFYYDGSGSFFYRSLIHRRIGYVWAWPIHETLLPLIPESTVQCDALALYHLPDPTKSRESYLPQLEEAVRQNPQDSRMVRYLGREYYYRGMYAQAIDTLSRHTELEHWDAERAASFREMARCRWQLGDLDGAEGDYRHAIEACPDMREGYIELARLCLARKRYDEGLIHIRKALAIDRPHPTYFNEGWAWNGLAEQMEQEFLSHSSDHG